MEFVVQLVQIVDAVCMWKMCCGALYQHSGPNLVHLLYLYFVRVKCISYVDHLLVSSFPLQTAVQRAHEVKSTLPEVTRPPPRPLVIPQSETDGEDVSSIDGTTSLEGSGGTYILNRGSNCSDE